LLEAGVRVAVTDKPGGTLDDAVRELSPLGEIVAVTGDVTKVDEVTAIWRQVREKLGDPDIYVNAAGVTGATGDFLEVDDAGWL
ncbi:SDR family oxidoreductase, partial [Escherichia coli]